MSEIETHLFKLFSEYSTPSTGLIRFNRLTELCEEAHIFTDKFKAQQLQVLFATVSSRSPSVGFAGFCELLPRIAEEIFPEDYNEDPSIAFERVVFEHFFPLACEVSQRRSVVHKEDLNLSNNIILISQNLHKSFREIFVKTFSWEFRTGSYEETHNSSLRALEKLLKEFEMYPNVVSKGKLLGIWRDVVIMQDAKFQQHVSAALLPQNFQDIGRVFTLSKFILVFFFCSVYGAQENSANDNSNTDKFLVLLERVQLSLANTWKNINLRPAPEVMAAIMQHETQNTGLDENAPIVLSEAQLIEQVWEKHQSKLSKVFQGYCAKGTTEFWKSSNFHKFVKDSELPLTHVDVDLVYNRAIAGKFHALKQRAMDFQQFLACLEHIARKINTEKAAPEAVEDLVQNYIVKVKKALKKPNVKQSMEILDDPSVKEALEVLKRSLVIYFKHYADGKGQVNFSGFLSFAKDFDIFPDILSQSRLSQVFLALAPKQKFTKENFVQAIAVIACEVSSEEDPTNVHKICNFIERLGYSQGPTTVQKSVGRTMTAASIRLHSLLQALRIKYKKKEGPPKPSFEELAAKLSMSSL